MVDSPGDAATPWCPGTSVSEAAIVSVTDLEGQAKADLQIGHFTDTDPEFFCRKSATIELARSQIHLARRWIFCSDTRLPCS
jgi:uncharacterized protein YcgI (DUF1989 family)